MSSTLIKNARIIDGTGSPWYKADIRIENDRIAAIGALEGTADMVIDAEEKVVAPGFIDIHTHSDIPLLVDGRAMSHITQGVTTNVVGNCGNSPAPLTEMNVDSARASLKANYPELQVNWSSIGEYLKQLDSQGVSVNVVSLVGQGTVRGAVMGYVNRPPSEKELADMRALVRQAMEEGAFGLSSGLIYVPGSYAATDEVTEMAKVVAEYKGIYSTHIRGENDTLVEAVAEAIHIGKEAHLPVQIAHFKAMGTHMWGASKETLRMVEEAREQGIEVTCDQYPYNASATGLSAYLPAWAHIGGKDELMKRLRDPRIREKLTQDILNGTGDWVSPHKGVGWDKTLITKCNNPAIEGLSVSEIAKMRGLNDFDAAYDLLIENEGQAHVVYFTIGDEDLERIMSHPCVMIGSDSGAVATEGPLSRGKPHPRSLGTFVRVLGPYIRDKRTISLESAVHKMTAFPAQKLGLFDRGILRPGLKADVVIFDPETVGDRATYTHPHQYATGIEYVFVNGQLTIEKGQHVGTRAGEVLRKKQA